MSIKRKVNYCFNESFNSIFKNGLMSIVSILTIIVSMFTFSFFLSAMMNLNFVAKTLESQVEISVFLSDDANVDDRQVLEQEFNKISNVKSFQFVSKNEALESLKTNLDLHTVLDDVTKKDKELNEEKKFEWENNTKIKNPLPNIYKVAVYDTKQLEATAQEINNFSVVENVAYGENIIERVFSLTDFLHALTAFLIIILFLATIFIISNIMTISVHSRKTEIEIMRYIGATNSMIYFPFMLEGAFLGFIGGLGASLIFRLVYGIFVSRFYDVISFISLIPPFPFLTYMSITLVVLGMGVGAIGSLISVRRYTKA